MGGIIRRWWLGIEEEEEEEEEEEREEAASEQYPDESDAPPEPNPPADLPLGPHLQDGARQGSYELE